ncbi:hypothetical protein ABZV77_19135 [Streptomyces sp. NPDC004732]|uniref:hypothetical protein n=1 Tax=Streptomyces sp. NPDC004732 TaxID=3154290 RepID=UPI0033B99802
MDTDWINPEQAYAAAPNILREIGWTARTARDPDLDATDREYWLRKAAVLDRIALTDEAVGIHGDAAEVADASAQYLMDLDRVPATCDPRHYVRREYAAWAKSQ